MDKNYSSLDKLSGQKTEEKKKSLRKDSNSFSFISISKIGPNNSKFEL